MQKLSHFPIHKNHRILIAASAVAMLAGISSCSDYDNGYDDKTLAYKESFIEAFGTIDPNHTWNMAQSCTVDVTINLPGVFTVKVWTADPRMKGTNSYLLGKYENVQSGSTHSFQCDIPSTVETAYVGAIDEDGNRFVVSAEVKNGKVKATIGAEGSRFVVGATGGTVEVSTPTDKLELKAEEVLHPTDRLPEFENNTGKVTQNFEYYSQGPFTIYPIYTITGNPGSNEALGERIGIYIVDANGNKGETQWVWQPKNNGSYDWIEAYNVDNESSAEWSEVKDPKSFFEYLQANKVFMDKCTRIRTEGITINIPVGTRFGFAIDAHGGGPYYSNSDYNGDHGSPYGGSIKTDGINDTYAATFIYDDMLYLAFEDWFYGSERHDNDFNDVVFRFKDDITRPLIIDKDVDDNPMQYIVACEDLGGSFDWDFNDVVYGIEHVSGQTNARIKLFAAGGTLPVHITYDNKDIYFNNPYAYGETCTDLHQAFGVEQDVPVNVGIYQTAAVYSHPFTVDANAFSVPTDAQKFKIHVSYKDGSEGAEIGVPGRSGVEPQAFLVADPNWKWPNELQHIKSKYSDFAEWVKSLEEKGWCGSVWGLKSTSAGDNLLEIPYAVSFDGNVATANLPNRAFPETDNEYIITVLAKDDAVLTFVDPSGHPLQVVVDGSIKANQRTFFTLSPDVTKKIRDFNNNNNGDCKMIITFANGVVAKDMLVELSNRVGKDVVSASKLDPKLTANEIVMKYGQNYTVEYSSKSAGACTFESLNTNVLRVDDRGNLTRVAIGKTTIVVTQAAYGDYKEAVTYVPVIVEGDYRNPYLGNEPVSAPIAVGETIGRFYRTPELNKEPYVFNTVVTSNNPAVATASLGGNWLKITGVSAGRATITLKQPETIQYYESTLEVPVEVIRKATAETITYVGGGDNGSWNSTTSQYTWNTITYNLLQVFALDENEIDKYKGFCFTVSDPTFKDGGNYRVVLLDASDKHVAKIEKLEGAGTRTCYFNVDDSPNDGWNKTFELENGRKLSEVRKIMVGGGGVYKEDGTSTGSGKLNLTNCYLVNK